jgi:5-methylcytosine-specific restriction endonuclease McrA
LKLGGPNTIDNAQLLCRSCNSHKHLKSTDYRPSPIDQPT